MRLANADRPRREAQRAGVSATAWHVVQCWRNGTFGQVEGKAEFRRNKDPTRVGVRSRASPPVSRLRRTISRRRPGERSHSSFLWSLQRVFRPDRHIRSTPRHVGASLSHVRYRHSPQSAGMLVSVMAIVWKRIPQPRRMASFWFVEGVKSDGSGIDFC
jgi:hypothetical protein